MKRAKIYISFFLITGALNALESLPTEMLEEIVSQAEHPEECGKSIRELKNTNKKLYASFESNIKTIITDCARKFSISPLVAALYIATPKALSYFNDGVTKLSKQELSNALDDVLRYYTGSHLSNQILKKLLEHGARFKESFSNAFQNGWLFRNFSGEKRLELYSCPRRSRLIETWGNNGKSVHLAGTPWISTVQPDNSIVAVGTINKPGDFFDYDLFMQTISQDGKTCSPPKIIRSIDDRTLPSYLYIQPKTHHWIIILKKWKNKVLEFHICVTNAHGELLSEHVLRINRRNR